MIEQIIYDFLSSELSVPVAMEVPASPPDEYVVVTKTGSGSKDHIHSAMIVIRSYSDSLYNASKLNETVKLAMLGDESTTYGIVGATEISKCQLNTDYNATDTQSKKYRYQAVFDLAY